MMKLNTCLLLFLLSTMAVTQAVKENINNDVDESITDLEASPTSAKLFNLGSLFGQTPNYPYGYGNYGQNTNYYRPQYPMTGGYYPSTTYQPSVWTGTQYYPNQGTYGSNTGNYNPSSGSYYPSTGNYYPTNGYYPTGTNILGSNGGYGGYGGNGGLRQYYGYWSPQYSGQRNRGYGYFADTDRYGLPRNWRGRSDNGGYSRARDRISGGYRGYD